MKNIKLMTNLKFVGVFVSAIQRGAYATVATAVLLCCGWCSVAMAQAGDGGSAPQVRVRIFLEAPLGTAVMAPLAVRAETDGSVLRLVSRGVGATTQVKVVIYASDPAADLSMMIFTDAAGAEVVEIPEGEIMIAADGMMRRSAQFELKAKTTGTAIVMITVRGGGNEATTSLRIEVEEGGALPPPPQPPQFTSLTVIEPQADTALVWRLLGSEPEATTQLKVIIDASHTAADLSVMISTDDAGAEVVEIPSDPIMIAADGNTTRRSTSFELKAKTTGRAMLRISVTDGVSTAMVALRLIVVEASQVAIISPQTNTELRLLSRGAEATTQVPVVIDTVDTAADLRMTVSVDAAGAEVIAIPSTPIVSVADGDALLRRAHFELMAKKAGTTTVTIVVTDGASTDTVALRVIVANAQIHIRALVDRVFVLRLADRGVEVTTQVKVEIETDTTAELTMALSVDASEVVAVPSTPIVIVADGDALLRRTSFELTAKTTGAAIVRITVTDGASTATLALPVIVVSASQIAIISPQANTELRLLSRGPESMASVQVVIDTASTATELRMRISVDNTEVVAIPSEPIVIDGAARQRLAHFELMAKEAGMAEVRIVVTDGVSTDTVALRVIVTDAQINIRAPVDSVFVLRLPGRGVKVTTQVQVVIETDTTAELTMALSVDASEVVAIPSTPIVIGADGDAMQRRASFELTAKTTGTAIVSIAVTDGASTATLALPVIVVSASPIVIISPQANTELRLLSRGVEATTQVPVVIDATDTAADLRMMISTDESGTEVVAVPSTPIVIVAGGDAMQRSISFELAAKQAGTAIVSIAVSDGASTATVVLRVVVEELPHTVAVIEPQTDAELRLLSSGVEAMTQVQVVVDASDTAADLRMTISTDESGAEVVTIPSEPIIIMADGDALQRRASFELTAKGAGMAIVSIAVSDGASTATVVLRVVVEPPPSLQILSPSDGTQIALVRENGSLAATQVEVILTQTNVEVPVALDLQLEGIAGSPVFISTTSLTLTASADGSTGTRFTLAAAEAGTTTLRLVASDRLGNREEIAIRVSVTRVAELCASCLVPDMRTVPEGTFTMGSSATETGRNANEGPQHRVDIGYSFAVGQYALTRGQYRAFVEASGYAAGSAWLNPGITQSDAHPVVNVSWDDAKEYISWLSEQTGEEWRLLSEAEWEYAARAGTTTSYAFGNTINATQARFGSSTGTVAVGSYAANEFALYDMHGNVLEWVEDCWHGGYNEAPSDGSAWLSDCDEEGRVLRGGSWNLIPRNLRSANRYRSNPRYRFNYIGFRVARTL